MLSLSEHRSIKKMLPALSVYSCYIVFWMILSYRNGFQHKVLFFLFLILFVLAACLFFWAGKIRKSCGGMGAAFLCFASFMACGYLGYYERLSEYFVDLDIYDEIKNSAYGRHSEEDQSRDALRTDIIDTKNMAALILGNPGTYSYFSIQNDSLYDFFRDMTCSCSIYGGNVQMRTLDGRRSLEMLMGVGTYSEDEDGTILHDNNDLRLPLGFTYDSYALNSDVAQLDSLSKSTAVLDTVYLDSVPDIDVPKVELEEIENNNSYEIVPVEISYPSSMTDEGIMAVDSYDIIDISLSRENMELDESSEYYLYFESIETDRDWGSIDINQMKKMRFSSAGEASNEKGEYLARIPINDEIKKSGHITLGVSKGNYKFGTIEIRKVDTSDYATRREELINDSLEDIKFTPNSISGRITCENDKLLFVSLLFDKRWKCFVDGDSQKLLLADSGFTAIELTEGTHDVMFKYDCTLNILSAIVSLLSIIVVIAWMKKDVGK
ncbi:YfhO family protein [Butyrivibrio sp. FCS006]|uniref:YfhO family protein n=1 Tax=Butyrivibrio sp. FCS006 TaxID=1280684 RepID=UPI001FA76267|nr:YfhO family protein [Butyrivibrio sp. FCS006]